MGESRRNLEVYAEANGVTTDLYDAAALEALGVGVSIEHPLISVITPYKNARLFLRDFVASLKTQTFTDWECVLVSHNSDDDGDALANELTHGDDRFVHIQVNDESILPTVPRNLAISHARGQYICFLDVDDWWHPCKLERQLAYLRLLELDVCVTAYVRHNKKNRNEKTYRCPPARLDLQDLMKTNPVPLVSTMIRREFLLSNRFSAVRHEDYQLWIDLWKTNPNLKYGCLSELLSFHQRHGENLTSRHPRIIRWIYGFHLRNSASPYRAILRTIRWIMIQTIRIAKERIYIGRFRLSPDELAKRAPMAMR